MTRRWRLFPKYALLIIALVGGMLIVSAAIGLYFSWRETEAHLRALQDEKARSAADRIERYVLDIAHELSWTALPRSDSDGNALEERRFEYLKLQRQAPAVTEVAWIDPAGREQLRISRLAVDAIGGGADLSQEAKFQRVSTRAVPVYYGPVYFRKGTEPYMTIAAPAGPGGGVTAAEVNLKFVLDVVSRIKIGNAGLAYVVDADGLLVAHPDISLVLKKSDLSGLPQVATLRHPGQAPMTARNLAGEEVFSASAPIETLHWTVFVETPRAEAFAPLYATLRRTSLLLVAALLISIAAGFFVARALVRPLRALQEGAARIGAGDLDRHIEVRTGDELEGLAAQFNRMSDQLRESYAGLERKVEQRTAELTEALDHQTAISDVLRVISQSPQRRGAGLRSHPRERRAAVRNAAGGDLPLRRQARPPGGGAQLDARGHRECAPLLPRPARPADDQRPRHPQRGRCSSEEDTFADPAYDQASAQLGQWRRMIGAPLIRDGSPIGAIVLAWREPGKTPQRLADLLETFADQAVIAIENVRLFNETREALQQQTATAEVLRSSAARSPTACRCSRRSSRAATHCSRARSRASAPRRRSAGSHSRRIPRRGGRAPGGALPLAARRPGSRLRPSAAASFITPTCSATPTCPTAPRHRRAKASATIRERSRRWSGRGAASARSR